MLPLSVIIITFNEEHNIKECIHSLPDVAEIIVFDSLSKDMTTEIASSLGAKVISDTFEDFSTQRNKAIESANQDWILFIDADERSTKELNTSLHSLFSQPTLKSAYKIERRLNFLGQELRFGKTIDHPLRLFKKNLGHYENKVHEHLVLDAGCNVGSVCGGYLLHNSYESLHEYYEKLNFYTDKISENKSQMSLFNLYFRFWFEFISRYFLRLGVLDGKVGYIYALLSSFYAFSKYVKVYEKTQ